MSKNNSPLKFIGGMMGNSGNLVSGGALSMAQRVQNFGLGGAARSMAERVMNARNAPGGLAANMNNASVFNNSTQNSASSMFGNNEASTPPSNPGSVSGVSVSQADLNTSQNRNSGPGVLQQAMHEMNSSMPMVKPMASKPRMQPGMGYSSVMSPFSPPELSTGDSLYGGELQKQEIMNPMPEANIDATGMNSLYGGPLSMDGGPKAFMGINPDHKGYCTPMTKPTCTPRRKALAKRLKPGGDLYKSKK